MAKKELLFSGFMIILNIICLGTGIGMIVYLTTIGQSKIFIAFGIISVGVNFLSFIWMEYVRWT